MTIHELEVDPEDVAAERVTCPSCGRPLWFAGERSMAVRLRDVDVVATDRVVNVVVTGAFPMIFATCTCTSTLHVKIRPPMPFMPRD